jgi:hypothetical protein
VAAAPVLSEAEGTAGELPRVARRLRVLANMKRALFFFWFFLTAVPTAQAETFVPPTLDWLTRSDAAYVVRVDSVKELNDGFNTQSVTFTVTEVLRGKHLPSLTLTAVEGSRFKLKGACILIHNPGGFPNDVGWTIEGAPEWWPLGITDKDGKPTAEYLGSLDGIRQYLRDHPTKP